MKKTPKLLLLLPTLALGLAACGPTTSSSSEKSSSESSNPSSASSTSSSESSTSSSSSQESITHRNAFVSALPEGAVTRNYDSRYDKLLDDFSGETLSGSTVNGIHNTTNFLRILVDSTAEGYPSSTDASIYKMATGSYQIQSYEGIGFKMRLVSGKLNYSNLALGLRGADSLQVYPLNLSGAVTPDGEALPTLSDEWQDVVISPNQSIGDDTTVYKNTDGTPSTTKVLDTILGFHLYALSEECSAVLEIKEVFLTNAGTETPLDSFNRTAVNKTDDTCYWRDSTGFILNQYLGLNGGATYTTPVDTGIADYQNVALGLLGDTMGATLTPIYGSGEGNAFRWSDLKDPDGNAVVNAVDGAFYPYVVNLAASGIASANLQGWKIASTTVLDLSSVFATNLQLPESTAEYPHLDTGNAKVFDSFSRTQAQIDTTYDAAATNTIVTDSGLNFSICYHGVNDVAVDGDNLVFAPTTDYTQVTEGSKTGCGADEYLVFVMKLGDGATLDNFRISSNNTGIVYANSWKAAEGLASVPSDLTSYPYQQNGYVWYIIDLAATGISAADLMDIYYTGAGTLSIDSIFFADAYAGYSENELGVGASVALDGTYHYMCGIDNPGIYDKIGINVTGDGTNATFATFRLEYSSSTIWANSALVITDRAGLRIDSAAVLPSTETFYIIDLAASGFTTGVAGTMNFHWDGVGASGTVAIGSVVGLTPEYAAKWGDGGTVTMSGGYQYLYGGYCDGTMEKIKFTIQGDGASTLGTFRLQYNTATIYANAGLAISYADGSAVSVTDPLPTVATIIYIDLKASGFATGVADHMHFHWDGEGASGVVTIGTVYGVANTIPYQAALAAYFETLPVA